MASTELRQRDVKPEVINGTSHAQQRHAPEVNSNTPPVILCSKINDKFRTLCSPCLASRNPLPENASFYETVKYDCMLPPRGNLAWYLQFVILSFQIWIVLYALTHNQALPGGNLFSLLILFICCAVAGYLTSFVKLPPLLGMLILGVMLRNVPGVKVIGEGIDSKWSGTLRKIALTVILTRAGLGLDIVKLRQLSWAVLRLAFIPCTAEILTGGIVSHFLLGFPWQWSLLLGCILGALSPAVTVPILVNLQDRRYGVAKGIPTMLLAAGGLDNVLCVTCFSVFMGIIFSEGDLALTIIKGPLGVLAGIIYGFLMGFLLWYIPSKDTPNLIFYRTAVLLSSGLIAIFGSAEIGLSGAGPLGCLTTAVVAAYKWRQRRLPGETDDLAGVMLLFWLIVQHFLFGLIGAAVNISHIGGNLVGYGILTLVIGLMVRSVASSTVTLGTGFSRKERVFVTMTWLAKATVQAAIGGLALDRVREISDPSAEMLRYGQDVLTLSVLAIVFCAPIGAILMSVFGPRFLVLGDDEDDFEVRLDNFSTQEEPVKDDIAKDDLQNELDQVDQSDIPVCLYKSQLSIQLTNTTPSKDMHKQHSAEDGAAVLEVETEMYGVDNPVFDASVEYENVDQTVSHPDANINDSEIAVAFESDSEGDYDEVAAHTEADIVKVNPENVKTLNDDTVGSTVVS